MKRIAIYLIEIYQKKRSQYTKRNCRFYTTCSEYSKQAILKYGFLKGVLLSIKRISKCHPFNPGGYDPLK